jgi:heat shock protein HslJ
MRNRLEFLRSVAATIVAIACSSQTPTPDASAADSSTIDRSTVDTSAVEARHKNIAYRIEGQPFRLTGGVATTDDARGSGSKIITKYLGNELRKDLNGDGRDDVAFLLTQERGGSGTFYYVVAALDSDSGGVGSDAVLLGDRVAPQATTSGPGRSIIVTYTDRKPGEPMTTTPSVARSRQLLLDPRTMRFGEVAQGFAGEADPARMTLQMKPWTWIEARYNDGRTITPAQRDKFTLAFSTDTTFSATTDCNNVRGGYSVSEGKIAFGENMVSTRKYCAGSQEQAFTTLLRQAQRYHFTSKGELVLDLKFDSGSVVFR